MKQSYLDFFNSSNDTLEKNTTTLKKNTVLASEKVEHNSKRLKLNEKAFDINVELKSNEINEINGFSSSSNTISVMNNASLNNDGGSSSMLPITSMDVSELLRSHDINSLLNSNSYDTGFLSANHHIKGNDINLQDITSKNLIIDKQNNHRSYPLPMCIGNLLAQLIDVRTSELASGDKLKLDHNTNALTLGPIDSNNIVPYDQYAELKSFRDLERSGLIMQIPRSAGVKRKNPGLNRLMTPIVYGLIENGYDIRLGENGRSELKKIISLQFRMNPKLRDKCIEKVCRLKNANVLQLLAMSEVSGCLKQCIAIANDYWKVYSEKKIETDVLRACRSSTTSVENNMKQDNLKIDEGNSNECKKSSSARSKSMKVKKNSQRPETGDSCVRTPETRPSSNISVNSEDCSIDIDNKTAHLMSLNESNSSTKIVRIGQHDLSHLGPIDENNQSDPLNTYMMAFHRAGFGNVSV